MPDKACYLYAPSDEPATWQLEVKNADGTLDMARVARAAALLSPRGFKGEKANVPSDALPEVKAKLVRYYKRLGRRNHEIPPHLLETKALPDDTGIVAVGGEIDSIEAGEYKGQRGYYIRGYLTTFTHDTYNDWPILTPELKASTEDYFKSRSNLMVEHARPYRGTPPVREKIGFVTKWEWRDDGLWHENFAPEPQGDASDLRRLVYHQIGAGEFKGFSPGGFFYRDTGQHEPPGIILDWQLYEHSICKNPVDSSALIDEIEEIKALLEPPESTAGPPGPVETDGSPDPADGAIPAQAVLSNPPVPPALPESAPTKETHVNDEQKPQDPALAAALERLAALEAEKKSRDDEARELKMKEEARAEAEKLAKEQIEAKAQEESRRAAMVQEYLQAELGRYQIQPMGRAMTAPAGAGRVAVGNDGRPRYTMAGPVMESKALIGDDGQPLPANMIEWLIQVKQGQRAAAKIHLEQAYEAKASGYGQIGIPTASTFTPTGTNGGYALPQQYLNDIVPLLVDQKSIRSLITVLPAESILLQVPKVTVAPTRAVVTAEAESKPKKTIGTDMLSIRLYTIPQIIDVTNQLLTFSRATAESIIREQLADAIRLAEYYYALMGSGTNEPYGLIPALTAYNTTYPTKMFKISLGDGDTPTGEAVAADETIPDVIARAINVTQLRFYTPDVMLVHPSIWWKLITTKDAQDRYLVDPQLTGRVNSVWGIRVEATTQIPLGKAVVGDFKKLRMYVAEDVTLDMSSEAGDRFDKNMTGFRIEEMMGLNAEQEIAAFTLVDFTTGGISSS
jgi:HK97 family phage major capsid protein